MILPILKPGDAIEIIAPASRCSDERLAALKNLLESWQLKCIVADDIFGKDILCANTDEMRFQHLQRALENTKTKAIICARGGYGSMRLIPALTKVKPHAMTKLFVGMSDITALQLYFMQQWQWPMVHGSSSPDLFSPESISALKRILFGEVEEIEFTELTALNAAAEKSKIIKSSVTGGNLCLIQAGIGTVWQMDGRNKIILLEEVSERGYRIDRMLEHLQQAGLFEQAAAIIFADFIDGNEPDGSSLIEPVINRFAKNSTVPMVRLKNTGHGFVNFPILFGTPATLQLGKEIKLTTKR